MHCSTLNLASVRNILDNMLFLTVSKNDKINMDKKMFSCGIFIDLKETYLTRRTQTTQTGMEISNRGKYTQ